MKPMVYSSGRSAWMIAPSSSTSHSPSTTMGSRIGIVGARHRRKEIRADDHADGTIAVDHGDERLRRILPEQSADLRAGRRRRERGSLHRQRLHAPVVVGTGSVHGPLRFIRVLLAARLAGRSLTKRKHARLSLM